MIHLSSEQIENYAEGASHEVDEHLSSCLRCQRSIVQDRAVTRALSALDRIPPSREFAASLEAAMDAAMGVRGEWQPNQNWIGVAAFSSMMLLLVFGYQTIMGLQYGGALDFLSLYASRPELISRYPSEALGALVESLPLLEFVLSLGLFILAAVLGHQFVGRWRSTSRPGAWK
jgi:hypothetical protein